MTHPTTENKIEEIDEIRYYIEDIFDNGEHAQELMKYENGRVYADKVGEMVKKLLKSYASSLLQEMREEIESNRKEYCQEDVPTYQNKPYDWHGYSHASSDILKIITSQENKLK